MVAAFPVWLDFYEAKGFGSLIKKELLTMSAATVDRYLKAYKKQFARNRRSGTNSSGASKFKATIPLKLFEEKQRIPGFVEADTVAHCGDSLSGKFTCKSYNVDNGTEFLNRYFVEYLEGKDNVNLTRSRPYRKNDNCHAEQKNFTHVRELFKYERLDHEELIFYMNEIYRDYFNPLQNFFTPQIKMISKSRVGSRYVRKFDKAKTPYQRLIDSGVLSMKQRSDLEKQYKSLNPILLKREMSKKINQFNSLKKSLDRKRKEDIYLPCYHDVNKYIAK